nr:hypothetical protein GCM10020093_018380 [Planobispora longispora]
MAGNSSAGSADTRSISPGRGEIDNETDLGRDEAGGGEEQATCVHDPRRDQKILAGEATSRPSNQPGRLRQRTVPPFVEPVFLPDALQVGGQMEEETGRKRTALSQDMTP